MQPLLNCETFSCTLDQVFLLLFKCYSTVGLKTPQNTPPDHVQTQKQLSKQLKCSKLTLLVFHQTAQQDRISPAAQEFIEMQEATFENCTVYPCSRKLLKLWVFSGLNTSPMNPEIENARILQNRMKQKLWLLFFVFLPARLYKYSKLVACWAQWETTC